MGGVFNGVRAADLKCSRARQGYREGVMSKARNIGSGFSCKVESIGSDWIVIAAGWSGSLGGTKKPNEGNDKPVRLLFAGTVAGGDADGLFSGDATYRLSDLKVGDRIIVETFVTAQGAHYCYQLSILRRPGGKIPPLPGDPFAGTKYEHHLREQAAQEWEEKGIPIPAEYLPTDGHAPWTNPPYPPVAPEPRGGINRVAAPQSREFIPRPIPPARP